jgi:ribosomal protein S27AE
MLHQHLNRNCPHCGGYLEVLTTTDPTSFNYETITKIVCTKCNRAIKEEELNNVATEESTTISTTAANTGKCPVCGEPLYMNRTTYEKRCNKCGYSEVTLPHNPLTTNLESDSAANSGTAGLMGWICPKCGRGLSPYTGYCPCSVKLDITCDLNSTAPFKIENMGNSNLDVSGLSQYLGYSRKDKLGYE